jgi:hypothetical protein
VRLAGLKAVFFVRDFAGDPARRERKSLMGTTPGRRIHVTFTDGETLVGTTQSYVPDGIGFYITDRPAHEQREGVRGVEISPGGSISPSSPRLAPAGSQAMSGSQARDSAPLTA